MKRTTKYVAFDVHQATTEGGQEIQQPAPQTARLSRPGGMLCAMTLRWSEPGPRAVYDQGTVQ